MHTQAVAALPVAAQGVGTIGDIGVVAGAPEGTVLAGAAFAVETTVVGEVHGLVPHRFTDDLDCSAL